MNMNQRNAELIEDYQQFSADMDKMISRYVKKVMKYNMSDAGKMALIKKYVKIKKKQVANYKASLPWE